MLVYVPPGEFEMGDGKGSDCPKHRVWVDGYYIGIYAVTNAQYQRFVEETGHRAPDGEFAVERQVVRRSSGGVRELGRRAGVREVGGFEFADGGAMGEGGARSGELEVSVGGRVGRGSLPAQRKSRDRRQPARCTGIRVG